MDIKPLKRHPALQDYSREHHDELLLVWKIRGGLKKNISSGRIKNYVLYYFNEFTFPHMNNEEEFILNKLKPEDADRLKILNDHVAIKDLVGKLAVATTGINDLLFEFANLLEAHIRYEERVFFPKLQNNFPEEVITGMQPGRNKSQHCETWEDLFWERSV
jgi:hypothetical protein